MCQGEIDLQVNKEKITKDDISFSRIPRAPPQPVSEAEKISDLGRVETHKEAAVPGLETQGRRHLINVYRRRRDRDDDVFHLEEIQIWNRDSLRSHTLSASPAQLPLPWRLPYRSFNTILESFIFSS
ncbi:unnamed protein product [Microthlaspi erraticum]|uniref:Uncharacterized protein n=1 Tax=Microthlaspi erraticum TaxID=1685480 RepID=A0A6D2LAP7_9BRAS|nr:unnamed protein product [Microthlaspi erraticum]